MLSLPPEGLATYHPDESPNSFTPLLNLTIGGAGVVACLEVFPQGGEAIPPHRHQATEIFVVLAGEGKARIGAGSWQEIGRGTALAVPPETTHTIRNTGDRELVCLTIMTPGDDLSALLTGACKTSELDIVETGHISARVPAATADG